MLTRKYRTLIAGALTTSLLLGASVAGASANEAAIEDEEYVTQAEADELEALHDALAESLALNDPEAIARAEADLEASGVTFLTDEEVAERFPEAHESLDEELGADDGSFSPMVVTPVQNNIRWTSSRQQVTYKSKNYEVQTLTAVPNSYNSPLKKNGTTTVKANYGLAAATTNFFKVVVSAAAGTNPYTLIAVTAYQAISAVVSGFKSTTTITNITATYTWAHVTTAKFMYVKPAGQADSKQKLSHIATKTSLATSYSIPSMSVKDGDPVAKIIQGSRSSSITPSCYTPAATSPVRYYLNETQSWLCYVGKLTITGVDGKAVASTYPIQPAHIVIV